MFCKRRRKPSINEEEELAKEFTKHFQQTKKLLLLGTGESGKTTIIKQMKVLHINGFSDEEKKAKIPYIKQNIRESIYDILYNMDKINPPIEIRDETNKESAEFILNLGSGDVNKAESSDELEIYTEEYFDHVKKLWADDAIQETFQRSNEYQLIDSAAHFLDRLDEIRKSDYIPTTQDILFCRIKTISISAIEFSMSVPKKYGGGIADFIMYDVGGQRGERKKWIQVFDGINAILFLIAASDFDQTLREDKNKNRLEEAFSVFKDIHRSRFVRDAGLIVFLNKQDLLKKKILQGHKLETYFPDYEDYQPTEKDYDNTEYHRAQLFMKKRILDISNIRLTVEYVGFIPGKNISETLPCRDIYIHFTIATDTNNIKKVFNDVHDIILKENWTNIIS